MKKIKTEVKRRRKSIKVLAMGTFDGLHPGHLAYLERAKKLGDHLIVVVARDKTVAREKGRKPLVYEKDRLRMVEHLDFVDKVVLGNLGDKLLIVEQIKPDVICLGYDHRITVGHLQKELARRGLRGIVVRRVRAYKNKKYKSQLLKLRGILE